MKPLFYFLLCMMIWPMVAEAQNPTRLWELRDSLVVLAQDTTYADDAKALLEQIQPINKHLSSVRELMPTQHLRIDVCEQACDQSGLDSCVQQLLAKKKYGCIALECTNLYLSDHSRNGTRRIAVTNPFLRAFVDQVSNTDDARIQYVTYLAKCVQTEIALLDLTFALRESRAHIGDELSGLLIVDYYFAPDHLRLILFLFRAQSNLFD